MILYLQVLVDASNDDAQSDRTDGLLILIGKERGVDHTGDERAHVDDATRSNNSCTKASSSGVQILAAAASILASEPSDRSERPLLTNSA